MNSIYSNIKSIQASIESKVKTNYIEFNKEIEKIEDPKVLEFVEKYIEWYIDKNKQLWCYRMFCKVLPHYSDNLNFFANLNGFIINYFYDDSSFNIKWYKHARNENRQLVQVECEKDSCSVAYPVVEYDEDLDNTTQNPQVILDAMYEYEEKEKQREEKRRQLKKLHNQT